MMASAYPHHSGGLQQPGIPHGHTMGPGPGPNPGQPMGQPMQMHPGVSGPNGPHVSQAGPMMGMQPGIGPGPSAHALSHLTPQAHIFQQQQQQMFAQNPALAMQAQQRQAMLRQQQQPPASAPAPGSEYSYSQTEYSTIQPPRPDNIDPTISQDHTAGREERERALLSTVGSAIVGRAYIGPDLHIMDTNHLQRLDTKEETYFNGSDEEETMLPSHTGKPRKAKRSSSGGMDGSDLESEPAEPQESVPHHPSRQLGSAGARPLKKQKTQRAPVNDGPIWKEGQLQYSSRLANQPGTYETVRNGYVIEIPATHPAHPEPLPHRLENTTPNQIDSTEGSMEICFTLGTEQLTTGRSSGTSSTNINSQKGPASVDAKRHGCEDFTPQEELQLLRDEIARLRNENSRLEKLACQTSEQPVAASPPRWIFLHRLDDELYFDAPHLERYQDNWNMECRKTVSNPEIFLEEQKRNGVAFAVIYEYEDNTSPSHHPEHEIQPTHTSVHFLCEVLDNAWRQLLEQDETMKKLCQFSCDSEGNCQVPTHELGTFHTVETFFYHFQPRIHKIISQMDENEEKQQLTVLVDFIMSRFGAEYDRAKRLFDNGLVTKDYAKYLFAPGAILISREEKHDMGFLQRSFAQKFHGQTLTVDATSWVFDDDGIFKKKKKELSTHFKTINDLIQISSLKVYPLEYADAQLAERLRARGRTFWRCRKSAYVSYTGLDMNQEGDYVDTRFLINVRTHWTMHGSRSTTHHQISRHSHMNEKKMAYNKPPDDGSFVYLLPPSVYGFEVQEKKWVNLQVDNIRPLKWNKDAFESLAIDKESKELIDALVNNKIAAEKATDMVRGKGNGLIILLHGGPGTGKTLTAESVAEIAEKPLYRVTCGDIGTEPREVEKYLQQVFHLGKIWDCVVLLDEADVFLEQRTLSDLSRNALVSVFLRTLEYYDGILILTSNRVGTFDEAFKSRIQLALHYEKLTFPQRMQIWQNFIRRLDTLEEDVDVDSILAGIKKLAKHEMNGRQIRNAITTARQLALFKKETLGVKHLEHSIQVSGKFDKYLDEVHDQIKDDEMARQDGRR